MSGNSPSASRETDMQSLVGHRSPVSSPVNLPDGTQANSSEHHLDRNAGHRTHFRRLCRVWNWFFTDTWALEYAAMTLAITTLSGIAIVLGVYGERVSSNWTYSITINTVLSTLASIMKGTMMLSVGSCLGQLKWTWYHPRKWTLHTFQIFDSASRGPMGSLWLLYTLQFWHLASIGCIVTLMALASDAFIQQSVSYPLRNATLTATIPFCQRYKEHGSVTAVTIDIEQSMKAAIYDGAMVANISQSSASISPHCPTGNCTFPAYASLSVCSECIDVSSLIEERCIEDKHGSSGECINRTSSLPNGLFLDTGKQHDVAVISSSGHRTGVDGAMNTDKLDQYGNGLLNLSMIILDRDPNATYRPFAPELAFDCALSLCVQIYKTQVTQGALIEDVSNQKYHLGYDYRDSDVTIPQGLIPGGSNLTFSIEYRSGTSLLSFLSNSLNGTVSFPGGTQVWTNDLVHAFYLNGALRVPQTMANIAQSMTNNMRKASGDNIVGVAHTFESYIHVRWIWLLFPLIMLVLAATFLVLTVWHSRKLGVPNWRSSALSVMMHGIHQNEVDGLDKWIGKEKISELESWAESVEVRLRLRRRGDGVTYGLVRTGG